MRVSVALVCLLSACQPQATRLLLLDLTLSEPAVLNGTAQPWRDEGYHVEYRRFFPHLTRADLDRYGTLIVLLGREPEAPSDALNTGDLALLTEWVLRGSVVVLGYDADGEGYLDRWTANRWLDFVGAGISIGDRLLEDTTGRTPTTTGHPQPWAEARAVGDEPLGSVYDPFPLERNNVVTARDITQVLAVTSRHAFVRAPRVPAPRPRAGVAAAARVGDGLVIVISRHALGTLGPQFRPSTAPILQLDALARTRAFLTALARWTRRPAEWAHIPPAAHATPLVLTEAPVPVELASPPGTPPREVDTMSLPVPADPNLAYALGRARGRAARLGGRRQTAPAHERRLDSRSRPRERPPRRGGLFAGRARGGPSRALRPRFDALVGRAHVRVRRARPPGCRP